MEVARRVGLPSRGLGCLDISSSGTPARVKCCSTFPRGKPLTLEDCREISSRASGEIFPSARAPAPARKLEILVRLLRNLKNASLRAGDLLRALAAVERIMILDPGDHSEIRERGMILAKLGLTTKALVDLETYLRLAPDALDTDECGSRCAPSAKRGRFSTELQVVAQAIGHASEGQLRPGNLVARERRASSASAPHARAPPSRPRVDHDDDGRPV